MHAVNACMAGGADIPVTSNLSKIQESSPALWCIVRSWRVNVPEFLKKINRPRTGSRIGPPGPEHIVLHGMFKMPQKK